MDSNESNPDLNCTKMDTGGMTTLLCVCMGRGGGSEGLTRLHVDVHACLSLVIAHPCNKYGCSPHHSAHLITSFS